MNSVKLLITCLYFCLSSHLSAQTELEITTQIQDLDSSRLEKYDLTTAVCDDKDDHNPQSPLYFSHIKDYEKNK